MAAEGAAAAPLIFLSYGRKDAQALAERLHADLTARGFRIWQDIQRIRTGWNWDEEIERGLRESRLLLALLSPHSVRRAGTQGNADGQDSVCLDEIAYARGVCRTPVVPVFAMPCQPPLLIYRLQAVDMARWRESEALYAAALDRLCDHLAAALKGEKREHVSAASLDSWDFAPFLLEKRRGFTGRQWLFDEIDEWRRARLSPALLITGDPGVGKSAVVAELVASNRGGQVLAYHCCQADTPATLEPGRFVRSIAGMLAARLGAYAARMERPEIQDALSESRSSSDPGSAFEAGVLAPLHSFSENEVREAAPDGACYFLIDALDEALTRRTGTTIVDLLASRVQRLPPWIGVVATTRKDRGVLQRLSGLNAQTIEAQDARNLDDVRVYVERRLASRGLSHAVDAAGTPRKRLVETLMTGSGGNFLFVTKVLDAVEARQLTLAQVRDLPPGLSSLYRLFFSRLYPDIERDYATAKVVLQVLAAAREALGRRQLADATGLDADDELPGVLARLSAFVPMRDGRYSLFHKSLHDWLTGWGKELDQPAAGEFFANPKKGHARLAQWCGAEFDRDIATAGLYALRHVAHHFAAAQRHDELARLLMDWRFLEGTAEGVRGSGTTVFDLISNLAAGVEALPRSHPARRRVELLHEAMCFDAHLIARHPTALFQCCWNRCWWYDAPAAAHFFEPPDEPPPDLDAPWRRAGEKLHAFMEAWRAAKEAATPGFVWMRSLRPLPDRLGSAQRLVIQAHMKGRIHLSVSPDETRLISGGEWGSVRLWDLTTGASIATFDADEGFDRPTFAPPGDTVLAVSFHGRCVRLDAANLAVIEEFSLGCDELASTALSPDGQRLAVCHGDGDVTLIELSARRVVARVRRAKEISSNVLAFSPDGSEIAAAGTAVRRAAPRGEPGPPDSMAVPRDGAGHLEGNCLRRLDASDLREIEAIPTAAEVDAVAYSPDGTAIAWSESGAIFYRAGQEAEPWSVQIAGDAASGKGEVCSLCFSPDGAQLFYGVGDLLVPVEAEVGILNLGIRQVERRLYGHSSSVLGLAAYHGGKRLVSSGHDSTIRLWSLDADDAAPDLPWYERQIDNAKFSPDGRLIYTASKAADTVIARELSFGAIERMHSGHESGAAHVAVSPDGRRLATGDGGGMLRIWQTTGGDPIATAEGFTTWCDLRFSPDGRMIAAAGYSRARLYEAETGRRIADIGGAAASIQSVAFSGDGRLLAAVSNKTLWIADARTGELLREVHREYWPTDDLGLSDDGGVLVARLWSGKIDAISTATAERVEATEALARALEDSCSPFAWNLGRESERRLPESQQRHEMELSLRRDARPIAWVAVPWTHEMTWHPSGRAWALQHYRQLHLFKLEGDPGA